jgi:hypothetical protein
MVMWPMQLLVMSKDKRLAVFLWNEMSKTGSDVLHHSHRAWYIGRPRGVHQNLNIS